MAQPAGEDQPAATPIKVVTPPAAAAPAPAAARVVLSDEAKAQLSAADKARAQKLKAEAGGFFSQGRYKEAIEKFHQAYEITQEVQLLFNIGFSYEQLGAWEECVNFMDQYVEKAPTGPQKDRARNASKGCDARISTDQQLIIGSDPPGARVYIDSREKGVQGETPFRTDVRPGPHKIWVERNGFEPVQQSIIVQKKEPFRLNVILEKFKNQGWIFVDSTVIDARVYIDGKNVGLTPFQEPLSYPAGSHQIVVERDGYTRFAQTVAVKKGQTKVIDAYLVRTENFNSWRTPIGWTVNVLGLLAIGGGVTAFFFAEEEFNDTDKFKELALYEKLGYGVGGGLMALGTTLIVWDSVRDVVLDEHKNKKYGEPPPKPSTASAGFGFSLSGVSFGGTF